MRAIAAPPQGTGRLFEVETPQGRKVRHQAASAAALQARLEAGYRVTSEVVGAFPDGTGGICADSLREWLTANGLAGPLSHFQIMAGKGIQMHMTIDGLRKALDAGELSNIPRATFHAGIQAVAKNIRNDNETEAQAYTRARTQTEIGKLLFAAHQNAPLIKVAPASGFAGAGEPKAPGILRKRKWGSAPSAPHIKRCTLSRSIINGLAATHMRRHIVTYIRIRR